MAMGEPEDTPSKQGEAALQHIQDLRQCVCAMDKELAKLTLCCPRQKRIVEQMIDSTKLEADNALKKVKTFIRHASIQDAENDEAHKCYEAHFLEATRERKKLLFVIDQLNTKSSQLQELVLILQDNLNASQRTGKITARLQDENERLQRHVQVLAEKLTLQREELEQEKAAADNVAQKELLRQQQISEELRQSLEQQRGAYEEKLQTSRANYMAEINKMENTSKTSMLAIKHMLDSTEMDRKLRSRALTVGSSLSSPV